jgi:TATA-box binding protein (TBP) (component of TFIID and TFIIIB)
MPKIEDYVARIEETCGEEKGAVVTFKYDKRDEAIAKIMKKAKLKNSLSGIIFDLTFQGTSFRMFSSGKAIFKGVKNKEALHDILAELLLQH